MIRPAHASCVAPAVRRTVLGFHACRTRGGLKGRVLCASVRGMRYPLISALAICAIAAQGLPQQTTKRNIPCKTPENAVLLLLDSWPSFDL